MKTTELMELTFEQSKRKITAEAVARFIDEWNNSYSECDRISNEQIAEVLEQAFPAEVKEAVMKELKEIEEDRKLFDDIMDERAERKMQNDD